MCDLFYLDKELRVALLGQMPRICLMLEEIAKPNPFEISVILHSC